MSLSGRGEESGADQGFFGLDERTFTALAMLIGFAAMEYLTANQQNSLGNFLLTVGQVLETSATQRILLESAARPGPCELQAQIDALQQRLDALDGGAPAGGGEGSA